MRRQDAFRKLRTICQRLDEVDPQRFFVIPRRLYLLGSLLTDKPNPSDIDLLFEFQNPPNLDAADIVYRLSYGKPLPHEQASIYLRRGMKWVRIDFITAGVQIWLSDHLFPPDTSVKMVWEPGLDWRRVVGEIEAHPLPWEAVLEQRLEYLQETARQIIRDQGREAAQEWFKKQSGLIDRPGADV